MLTVVNDYLNELYKKVADVYDMRYAERLYYHIPVTETKANKFMVDLIFDIAWPAICIAMILKAEKEYDIIVHHSAFRKNAP